MKSRAERISEAEEWLKRHRVEPHYDEPRRLIKDLLEIINEIEFEMVNKAQLGLF